MTLTSLTESGSIAAMLACKEELRLELDEILTYWINTMVDERKGGFYGSVSTDNTIDHLAPKGVVLNSRILWTFSTASQYVDNLPCLVIAKRAFDYIADHFIDQEYGGVYWSLDQKGNILDSKKQIYGLAFCLYGLAAYYKVSHNATALELAKNLFATIEKFSFDKRRQGYIEAFTREWQTTGDLRLSEKDSNEKKTMNTHLHIIEAYAGLYQVWPDELLLDRIKGLLQVFEHHFFNTTNHHLHLFMTEEWEPKSTIQSFGHDIEASWLLYECAELAGDTDLIENYETMALQLADAAAEALDSDGGLWYEFDPATAHWTKEKHSWPQAEAMVGFFNAYHLSGEKKYLDNCLHSWQFIKKHIRDTVNGEWFWGVQEDGSIIEKEKAGFWKCPYHNSRACMELIKRITG